MEELLTLAVAIGKETKEKRARQWDTLSPTAIAARMPAPTATLFYLGAPSPTNPNALALTFGASQCLSLVKMSCFSIDKVLEIFIATSRTATEACRE